MIGLLVLGGVAIASSAALVYDYFSDNNQQPAVVIQTETTHTGNGEIDKTKVLTVGLLVVGAIVYLKYIRKK